MGFYVQANFDGKTVAHARLNKDSQDTRIELSFDDFMRVLDDFVNDSDMLSDEQFNRLLEQAMSIQTLDTIRSFKEQCLDCDGTNCPACGRYK